MCTISEHFFRNCASVSGTEVHLLYIAMYLLGDESVILKNTQIPKLRIHQQ